jgi:hypothetical protein
VPAQLALAAVYVAGMGISTVVGRRVVREQASIAGLTATMGEMVAPVPANPF